jgi:hypothetical protein
LDLLPTDAIPTDILENITHINQEGDTNDTAGYDNNDRTDTQVSLLSKESVFSSNKERKFVLIVTKIQE